MPEKRQETDESECAGTLLPAGSQGTPHDANPGSASSALGLVNRPGNSSRGSAPGAPQARFRNFIIMTPMGRVGAARLARAVASSPLVDIVNWLPETSSQGELKRRRSLVDADEQRKTFARLLAEDSAAEASGNGARPVRGVVLVLSAFADVGWLADEINAQQIPVIRLRRGNLVSAVLSEMLLSYGHEHEGSTPIHIDVSRFQRLLRKFQHWSQRFDEFCARLRTSSLDIEHAELKSDFPDCVVRTCRFLDVELPRASLEWAAEADEENLRRPIANFDEFEEAWRSSIEPILLEPKPRVVDAQKSGPERIGASLVSTADFPFKIGQNRVDEILSRLTLQRRKPFSPPANVTTICAVLFTSRSGSTWLGQLLGSSGRINTIREHMKPIRLVRFARWYEFDDLAECAERIIEAHAIDGLYGFKGNFGSLVPFVYCGAYAAYRDSLKVVLMTRRDIVGQAVSIRKAEITGVWHGHKHKQPPVPDEAYSYDAILKAILNIADVNSRLRSFAEGNGHPSIALTYEDLCADPVKQTDAILRFLNRPLDGSKSLDAKARSMRDERSKVWVDRFRSDLKQRAADLERLERAGIIDHYDVF